MAQVILINVSDRAEYLPQQQSYFNDARWQEAKKTLAWALQQHSKECKYKGTQWLMDRMVAGDFPAVPQGYHNGITCIANGGEHSEDKGHFSVYDQGTTYIYEAQTGDLCIAQLPDDEDAFFPTYYRVHVCSY